MKVRTDIRAGEDVDFSPEELKDAGFSEDICDPDSLCLV